MDPWSSILILIAISVLCFLSEFAKAAVLSQTPNNIRKIFPEDTAKTERLLSVIERQDKISSVVDLGQRVLMIIFTMLVSVKFAFSFAKLALFSEIDIGISEIISCLFLFIIVFLVLCSFSKRLPSKYAAKNTDKLCLSCVSMLVFFAKLFYPIYLVNRGITTLFLAFLGVNPREQDEEVTEDDIRMLVDVGEVSGTIEESEKQMIHNVFEFDDRLVGEITTHRTDITAIEVNTPLDEIVALANDFGFSRMPVYDGTLDNVIGLFYTKDLIKIIKDANGGLSEELIGKFDIREYMRTALYVPETNSFKELFEKFKDTHIQMAIVIDEYGGTLGIVTMEDLLESIMGTMHDEYDTEPEITDVRKISDNEYILNGLVSIKDVEDAAQIVIPNENNCETIGGLVVSLLGIIPEDGETVSVTFGNLIFKVLSVQEHHIEELFMTINIDDDREDETAE